MSKYGKGKDKDKEKFADEAKTVEPVEAPKEVKAAAEAPKQDMKVEKVSPLDVPGKYRKFHS